MIALAIAAPPSSHFIFIPVVLLLGIVIGFMMGSRATRDAFRLEQRKAAERDERKARRQAASSSAAAEAPK